VRPVLAAARTIAVLGAHVRPERPAHYVPEYLHRHGYRVLAVNPTLGGVAGLWGEPVRARLDEIGERVDVVDVFRRSDSLPGHLEEILAMRPRPGLVWLQLGVSHEDFARSLLAHGIDVVQDRCMLADHRALGLGRRG
jgi:hypothetical protein